MLFSMARIQLPNPNATILGVMQVGIEPVVVLRWRNKLLVTPYSVSTRGYDPVIIQFTLRKGCARAPASAAHRLARPPILRLHAAVALGCDLEGAPM